MRPILENREGLIDNSRGVRGHRKDVDRLVEAGICVEVGAKADADGLEVLDEIVLREVGRAVERRVLEEVSEAELLLGLENGAGVHDEPELRAFLGATVLADVVAQSVGKRADANLGIDSKARRQRIRHCWRRCGLLRDCRGREHKQRG